VTAVVERARRSQAERAASMRERLLDATIACLVDSGYGAMSTNDVVRRARVSRGALAHHFPTKTERVRAAAERLLDQRAREFRDRFIQAAPERRTVDEALRILWSFYDDPAGLALIELTVAARHSPELRAVIGTVPDRIAALTRDVVAEFFPLLPAVPNIDELLRAMHALYAGLALSAMAADGPDRGAAAVRTLIENFAARALPHPTETTESEGS
jgi:AcrR family transcriptional regulator